MSEWTTPGTPDDGLGPLSGVDEPGEALAFATTIRPKDFLGLSLKNGLLNIVTLTLWRFWGKTEVRRRIWRGVRMNGDAFEYTGRGVELFVGFLIALIVLGLPFLLAVFIAQIMLDPGPLVLLLIPLYIGMFWLFGFGIFTAFRYMASRTTWRGIRFRLAGSAAAYGGKYLLYLFLTSITLGWFQPEAHRNLSQATWDNLYFGTRRVRFRMERSHARGVYGAYAIGWFGQIGAYIGLFMIIGMVMFTLAASGVISENFGAQPAYMATQEVEVAIPSGEPPVDDAAASESDPPTPEIIATENPPFDEPSPYVLMAVIYGGMLLLAPIWMLVWAPYQAAILRSIVAGITIDKAGFKLDVKAIPLWWLTVTNLFFILITLGFLMPWVQARTVKFITERLTSAGEVQMDRVEQTGTGPRTGEGLADAFGFSLI